MPGVKVAVVGHVDFIDFVRVARVPEPGEIVTAGETWGEAAGGGGMAAVRLAALAGGSTFFTALGRDDFGQESELQLAGLGVRVEAEWRNPPQRRGICYLDDGGERTITLLTPKIRPSGAAPLPWHELAGYDAVYFTGGDAAALRAARAARVLVATSREAWTVREAGVEVDALVGSASDPDEQIEEGELDPPPRLVFWTDGQDGGRILPSGERWQAVPLPGPLADSYGAGDTFAACLAYALADGRAPLAAAEFAARESAEQMTRRGAHGVRR
jgi:ribokinase